MLKKPEVETYRVGHRTVDAIPLLWSTWNDVCDLAEVGKLTDGKPEGCHVDASGHPTPDPNGRVGLLIPTPSGLVVGIEGDYVTRTPEGKVYAVRPDVFKSSYRRAEKERFSSDASAD